MAMTKCRECGKDVSSSASSCPHCGIKHPGGERVGCVLGTLFLLSVLFVALIVVAKCSGGSDTVYSPPPVDLSYGAKQLVRARLRDPKSAEFRNVTTHGRVVCGEVNARNGFGGMTGFQRFVAAGDSAFVESEVKGGLSTIWNRFCR